MSVVDGHKRSASGVDRYDRETTCLFGESDCVHQPGCRIECSKSDHLLAPEYRRHATALFLLGVLSHHALDLALLNASGYSEAVFWPLTEYSRRRVTCIESDPWPALVAAAGAVLVWILDRRASR